VVDPNTKKQEVIPIDEASIKIKQNHIICPVCVKKYKYFVFKIEDLPKSILHQINIASRDVAEAMLRDFETRGIYISEKVKKELLPEGDEKIVIKIVE